MRGGHEPVTGRTCRTLLMVVSVGNLPWRCLRSFASYARFAGGSLQSKDCRALADNPIAAFGAYWKAETLIAPARCRPLFGGSFLLPYGGGSNDPSVLRCQSWKNTYPCSPACGGWLSRLSLKHRTRGDGVFRIDRLFDRGIATLRAAFCRLSHKYIVSLGKTRG